MATVGKIFSGFEHLAGKTVSVIADGTTLYEGIVVSSSGVITLLVNHSSIVAGLPYTCLIKTNNIEGRSVMGSSQSMKVRISRLVVSLIKSYRGMFGSSESNMYNLEYPVVTELYTGKLIEEFDATASEDRQIVLKQSSPYPMNINYIAFIGDTEEQ